MVATNVRRAAHSSRRAHVRARHESAFCRRENAKESRTIIADSRRSNAFWRRYWSPKQVAKRRRIARIAARRAAARHRRERAILGSKFVHFAKCPTRISAAAKKALRKEKQRSAKAAKCRKATPAASASTATKAARSAKARSAAPVGHGQQAGGSAGFRKKKKGC